MGTVVTPSAMLSAIKTICEAYDANALVIPRRLLGIDDDKFDADILVRPDATDNKALAISFWVSGVSRLTQPRIASVFVPTTPRKVTQVWVVQFRCYREYATGTTASNAELDFLSWIEGLADAFTAKPKLGLDGTEHCIDQHGDLQFPSPGLQSREFGKRSIFMAVGTLRVHLFKTNTPT